MASDRAEILRWFHRYSIPKGIFKFEDLLYQAAIESLGRNPFDAKQYVQANLTRLWNYILSENNESYKAGVVPLFSTANFHQRTGVYPPKLNLNEKKKRFIQRNLDSRPIFLKTVDDLNHRQYEALGCLASIVSGADRHFLTPPGNEGGIDFFSRIRQPGSNHVFSGAYSPIRVIGQSKKYTSKVTISKVREFNTVIDNVKSGYKRAGTLTPDWFSSMKGPVIGWMIAHNGFQSGAVDYAKDIGIVLSNSVDVVEILSLSRKFYPEMLPDLRAEKIKIDVDDILAKSKI